MPLVSIIIPAYNAEKTIERAINSALVLDFEKEVIVVENGSTDNTFAKIREIAKTNSCVRVYQSEKGVSRARNAGIDNATGKYTMFLDADDCFERSADVIPNEITNDPDIDLWLFGHHAGNQLRAITKSRIDVAGSQSIERIRVQMLENPTRYMSAFAKLFKTSIIKTNGIRFREELSVAEDSCFVLQYTKHCKAICLCPISIYQYTIDQPSTMRSINDSKVQKYAAAMNVTQELVRDESELIRKAFIQYVLMHMNIAFVRSYFQRMNKETFRYKLHRIKEEIEIEPYASAISSTQVKDCHTARMLPVLFFKLHLPVLAALVYQVRGIQNSMLETRAVR